MKKPKPTTKATRVNRALGPKKDSNHEWFNVLKFVAFFALAFFFLQLLFSLPVSPLPSIAALSSEFLFGLFGRSASIDFSGAFPILSVSGISNPVELVSLCSGATELAAVLALVFASVDRTLKQRIFGALAGMLAIFVFNPIRIFLTLSFYNSSNPAASLFAHDVLFRASLLVLITVFYAVWYYWDLPVKRRKDY